MKKTTILLSMLLSAGVLASTSVQAKPESPDLQQCNNSDVSVSSISVLSGPQAGTTTNATYNASACAGAISGNTAFYPHQNLGYYGDGLLNGGVQNQSGLQLFPNGAFSDKYTSQDLNKDGVKDPGWIYLGKWESGSFTPAAIDGQSIVQSNWFSVTTNDDMTGGTWSINPDVAAMDAIKAIFGNNLFDQFALTFKSADNFAMYDFTAADLGLPLDVVHGFSGTWDMSNTLLTPNGKNPAGISHIELWVRDPVGGQDVPEPASLALASLGLMTLGLSRRRRSNAA